MISQTPFVASFLYKKGSLLAACDPAGVRTQDPILKRDVLYQLSY